MKEKDNVHEKHRKRMREKVKKKGLVGMPEHEILEMLIYFSIPRIDTNEIAHKLIRKFGSLKNVLNAPADEIEEVYMVGGATSFMLNFIGKTFNYLEEEKVKGGIDFSTSESCLPYIEKCFSDAGKERLVVFFLQKNNKLKTWKQIAEGTGSCVNADIKDIVKEASLEKAYNIIIAHNHPGGKAFPSNEDKVFTNSLSQQLSYMEIGLKDHYIITDDDYFSFRESGLV